MTSRRGLLFVAIALQCGCRCGPAEVAPDAAPSDATAALQADPRSLRVVATMTRYSSDVGTTVSVDLDGTLYVVAGGMAYEAREGTLAPVLPVGAYVPTMPPESAPLFGFEGGDDPIVHVAKDARGALRVFGGRGEWTIVPGAVDAGAAAATNLSIMIPMAFRDGLITTDPERGLGWVGADKGKGGNTFAARPAPAKGKRRFNGVTVAHDGALVAPVAGFPEVALWPPGVPLDAGGIVALGAAPDAGNAYRECRLAPSFDDNVYVCCESSTVDAHAPSLHRRDGARFVEAFSGVALESCWPAPSIDRAGDLYRVEHTLSDPNESDRLERCAPNGTCERVVLEAVHVRRPHYTLTAKLSLDREGALNDAGARWLALGVEEDRLEARMRISAVYARAPDDIWVIGSGAIFHSPRPGPSPAVLTLPTRADARALVQNEHPPVPWTKDCDSVFIELAAGASVDAGGPGAPLSWQVVTGRLHDREVTGVVAWRNGRDRKRDEMNQKIEQLVGALTRDPRNVPRVYCTLPVLSRVPR